MNKGLPRRVAGQSLFEVVIALAVITLVLVTLVALAALSIRNSTFSRNRTNATLYAQQTVEWLRGQRDNSWTSFYSKAAVTKRCLTDLSWKSPIVGSCGSNDFMAGTGNIFHRELDMTGSGTAVDTTVIISWADAQGAHEVRTTTTFTNWRNQ